MMAITFGGINDMKRILLVSLFGGVLGCLLSFSVLANFPVAPVKSTTVYKSKHYGESGQYIAKKHHLNSTPEKTTVVIPAGENHYAVKHDVEGMEWLNRNTKGDIFDGGAPIYHKRTGEHLGYFILRPGFYHLNFTKIGEVRKMKGYKELKKLMGDRVELSKPIGKGHFVGIKIHGPKD